MVLIRNIVLPLVVLTSASVAYSATLEECATLLPDGHKYKVEITFDVDKTADTPDITGSFAVKGGTDESMNFDIGDFVECAGPLIKKVEPEGAQDSDM